jgi:Asp/Glu/hydantoin racemase
MSNTVNIPSSVKEINNAIARRISILAEWQAILAKTRKNSLRASRQLQVDATRQQILELRQARKEAILNEEAEKAQAFVASLASVRTNWDNGLFD